MPEVPQNMQEDLQRLESNARRTDAAQQPGRQRVTSMTASIETVPPDTAEFKPFHDDAPIKRMSFPHHDAPSFSPFPKVKGDNIPPSDEAKEEILYNAREHVLHSNNVSMQLAWARDALAYVETAAESAARENPDAPRAQTPKVEHELRSDAVNIVNYLAGQDHPEALFTRSKWLELGKFGRRVDKKEAYLGYKRAAEQGWGRAEYRMGMLYENSNDFEKAVVHYNKGLDLNDSAAAYRLGMMYLLGQHSYRKDYQRGLDLIRQAAETADEDAPQGAYVYGMLIARDLPDIEVPDSLLPYDAHTAKLYIEKAAYLGFSKAQLKMGQAYELCQMNCDFNPSYSLHYYGLASRQGNSEAALGVSRWFLFGYEGYFTKNEQLAYQYAQQAANDKIATGYFAMGYFYEIGIYVRKDLAEARRWYEMAADNGNTDAQKRIESLDNNKSLNKDDHETKALDRIKSKHGSMRGKRPERFSKQNQVMPTLNESQPKRSPGPSPGHSPRNAPQDGVDFPDPERVPQKPPAFALNINNQSFPIRTSSAVPYPEDGRPPPLNINRGKPNIPYPEDDTQGVGRGGPGGYSQGPRADRPQSAFGIRPPNLNGSGRGGPGMGPKLAPGGIPPAGAGPGRGRGAIPPAGAYPPNNGPPLDYRRDQYHDEPPHNDPRMGGRGGQNGPGGHPPNRPGPGPGPQGHPSYGVGPRTSSRPGNRLSDEYGRPGSTRPDQGRLPPRMDSMGPPQGGRPSPGPGSMGPGGRHSPHPPQQLMDRPGQVAQQAGDGRQSAPPGQGLGAGRPPPSQRPTMGTNMSSNQSTATVNTTQSAPAKPPSQGPSTFDEMGIKPVKDKDDCVSAVIFKLIRCQYST